MLQTLKSPLTKITAACIHNKVLPQLLKACVNTKSASVRTGVLVVVALLAPRLTEQESDVVGRMIKHLTGMDSSDPTLSSVMDVCSCNFHFILCPVAGEHLRILSWTSVMHPALHTGAAFTAVCTLGPESLVLVVCMQS